MTVTLMASHRISSVPVQSMGRHVTGVVSEADLLRVQDQWVRAAHLPGGGRLQWHADRDRHWGLTGKELMTSPAITVTVHNGIVTLAGQPRLRTGVTWSR